MESMNYAFEQLYRVTLHFTCLLVLNPFILKRAMSSNRIRLLFVIQCDGFDYRRVLLNTKSREKSFNCIVCNMRIWKNKNGSNIQGSWIWQTKVSFTPRLVLILAVDWFGRFKCQIRMPLPRNLSHSTTTPLTKEEINLLLSTYVIFVLVCFHPCTL